MAEQQKPSSTTEQPPTHPPPTSEAAWRSGVHYPNPAEAAWSCEVRFPNPPDPVNPDPATLREQWQFATRRFSRWHSRAWGAAFLGGVALFAVGWLVKGSNPLPSRTSTTHEEEREQPRPRPRPLPAVGGER